MFGQNRLQLPLSERRLLLMLGDGACNLAAVLLALRIWAWAGEIEYNRAFIVGNLWWFLLLQALWMLIASANDFYDLGVAANLFRSASTLVQIMVQMILVYLIIFFLSPRDALPRLFILYYGLASVILIILWRAWRPFLIGWTNTPRRVMVVGSGWAAKAIVDVLRQEAAQEYEVACILTDASTAVEVKDTVTVLAEGGDLVAVAQQMQVTEIVLAYGHQLGGTLFQGLMDAYEQGYTLSPMPLLYEQVSGRVPIEHISQGDWNILLPISSSRVFNPYPPLKRLMDVFLALLGAVFFLPLLPLLALVIYADSPGSIFYRQERLGRGGRPFMMVKLRTMVPNAEGASGPQWAGQRDPRVTRVGRFLRKSRLDELPQLWNVLRGEMSIVGPRPERPFFVEKLAQEIPFYRTRHLIKPGVTGWAQVKFGYGATVADALTKLQYDLYYIRHRSLLLDVLIILRTGRKMLSLGGQ
jgi:exopolysaccharide biosynthesis polyprenyl glycosylphosphotransferase